MELVSRLLPSPIVRREIPIAILCGALLGCAGGGVYAAEDAPGRAEAPDAPAPDPWAPLPCEGATAAAYGDRLTVSGSIGSLQMGPCGDLVWIDPTGALVRMSPRLDDPERVVEGPVAQWRASRRRDAFLVADGAGGWSYVAPGAEPGPAVEATSVGFLRRGEEEIAWACVDRELGTLDGEGFHPRVSDVRLCERVIAAPEAPVLVFVADDFTLRAIHLAEDRLHDLSEVAYIAASSDQLALSRDGRILYHQPGRVAEPRIGIFDLTRPVGDRLIGAPRIQGGIHGVQHAPGAGHVAALSTEDGAVLLGADGFLRVYEEARLLSVAPDGAGALLNAPTGPWDGDPWDVFVAAPGRPRRPIATVDAAISNVQRSARGAALIGWGRDETDRFARGFYVRYRWDDEALVGLPGQRRIPYWVGEDGSSVTRTDDGAVVQAPDGEVLHDFPEIWSPNAYALGDAEVLLWLREAERTRLVAASIRTSDRRVLHDGAALRSVQVDRAGDRVATLRWEPDPDDPSAVRSVIAAGAAR